MSPSDTDSSTFVTPAPLLRLALGLDAGVSAGAALLHLAGGATLAAALAWPAAAVWASGVFMAGYAVLLAWLTRRRSLAAVWVRSIVVGNIAWSLGCAALAVAGALGIAGWGGLWLALLGAGPAGFALLQALGLRRSLPPVAGHQAVAAT